MIQEIISTIAVGLLGWLLRVIIKRDNNLNETIKQIKTNLNETKTQMKEMNTEIVLARVDSKTVTNVLIRLSNGTNYSKLLDEEKERLMKDVNFKYRD